VTIDELYTEAKKGDLKARDELFKALLARFRYFARQKIWDSDDAEDVVQDALVVINREYERIDIKVSFHLWAYKVFDMRVLGYIQKKGISHARYLRYPENESDFQEPLVKIQLEIKVKLLDCLNKILKANSRYARILNFQYQGFSTEEICEKLKVTRNNCYSILSRARSLLELCLKKGDIK